MNQPIKKLGAIALLVALNIGPNYAPKCRLSSDGLTYQCHQKPVATLGK